MNHTDLMQRAADRVEELVETVKFYMSEGIDKETALAMAREETTLSNLMWQEVVKRV